MGFGSNPREERSRKPLAKTPKGKNEHREERDMDRSEKRSNDRSEHRDLSDVAPQECIMAQILCFGGDKTPEYDLCSTCVEVHPGIFHPYLKDFYDKETESKVLAELDEEVRRKIDNGFLPCATRDRTYYDRERWPKWVTDITNVRYYELRLRHEPLKGVEEVKPCFPVAERGTLCGICEWAARAFPIEWQERHQLLESSEDRRFRKHIRPKKRVF